MRSYKLLNAAIGVLASVPFFGAAAAAEHPDLSGLWVQTATSHLTNDRPDWTAKGQKLLADDQAQHWHDGVSEENTYCLPAGMPFMMNGSEGFDLVQSPRELAVINEERPSPRHIYLDGRAHQDPKGFDRTTVGDSVGHWEGDTLAVDTVGFKPGATVLFVRSDTSHLVESYHLEDGGKHLRIAFTWTDPQLLAKPYSYTYLMERSSPGSISLEYYCDPRDPARARP